MPSQPEELKRSEAEKRNQLKLTRPRVYEKVMQFSEKVKRGESIAIIQFQYDYRCNFACEHCSVERFKGKKNARAFTIADVR